MRNNFVKVFLPVILTSIFFSSCFKKNDESLTAKKSMRLRWARQADPSTLDSSKCFLVDCRQILSLWLEGLTELKNDNQQLTVIPRLAESWTLSKSNVYRFQIKKNVVWSDGVPFTASDLIFSWRNGLTEKNPVLRQLFHDVVNADLFANRLVEWAEVGIKQRGLHTIEITLTSVNPRFPIVFSHPVTWPSRAKQNRKSIPSLGPFVLDQWVAGSHMVLNKNRKYHGRAPHLDGIDITIVPHAGTRIQLFLEHETDLVDAVPNEFTPQLWGTIGFEAIPTNTWMGVIFNTGKRPFNQSKVRQAFQQSINRSEFQDLLKWQDVGIPSLLMYSTTEGKHEPGIGPAFSASAAQGILADLKPDSPNLLLVFPPNDNGREIAQNLQAQWLKNINFKIDISSAPNAAAALTVAEIQSNLWTDPGGLQLFTSGNDENPARWKNSTFDTLLSEANQAPTITASDSLLNQAEQLLVTQEAVVLPLHYRTRYILRQPDIRFLTQTPIEIWDFRDTTVF